MGFGKTASISAPKKPRWIGEKFFIKKPKLKEGEYSVQSCLRRGHWRLQPCGAKGSQQKKIIWVEPTWVISESKIDNAMDSLINEGDNRKRAASFRTLVLRRYGSKCSLCNCSIEELIDAAHIIPFAEGGSDNPENGLPLCDLHHKAYDRKFFLINPLTTEILPNRDYSLDELKIEYKNLSHLINLPAKQSLEWRWQADKVLKKSD